MSHNQFFDRIGYDGKLDDISSAVCDDFKIGKFLSNSIITTVYEDFNFILRTSKGKYFVKIFTKSRTDEECKRLVDVMVKAMKAKVNIPRLYRSEQDYLHISDLNDCKLRLCVMDYIDGKDFFNLGVKPNIKEVKTLAKQAALIDSIKIKPKFVYDSWAIVNFEKEFELKRDYITSGDLELVEPLVKVFKSIKIENLPHSFVHGDIIATNVVKDSKGKLWVVDFSCANYYPRIQELAVLGCDLFFDVKSQEESDYRFKTALKEYQKLIHLTRNELNILPSYIKFAHAMHVVRASYEKYKNNNNSRENNYFLEHGRIGLRQ